MSNVSSLPPLGSAGRPLKVAVIGAGPSGFYAAEGLLKHKEVAAEVDLFDRLPTPYGLVRGGVAPDHQNIKLVTRGYERVARMPGFRFFGNVEIGSHISAEELRAHYDQIVIAIGHDQDRALGIPGEHLPEVYSANDFVGWYNGHPRYRDKSFDLSTARVAIVGVGNVALDVCRILAQPPELLAKTDITEYALRTLETSQVKEITLLGRRGPGQAAFSPQEIRRLGELEGVQLCVSKEEVALDEDALEALPHADAKRSVAYLQECAARACAASRRLVNLRFCVSPREILEREGHVAGVVLEKNELVRLPDGRIMARGTGRLENLPVNAVFRSVGYRGTPLPGFPFDSNRGRIPNQDGRVVSPDTSEVVPGTYVVGWAKRGPKGLIGANRGDAFLTVDLMLEDLAKGRGSGRQGSGSADIKAVLEQRQPDLVTFDDWERIDQEEVRRGDARGKIREKFTTIPDLLSPLSSPAKVPQAKEHFGSRRPANT